METPPNNLNLHELQPEKNSNKRISTNINKKNPANVTKERKSISEALEKERTPQQKRRGFKIRASITE